MPFWVRFSEGPAGCVGVAASPEEAVRLAREATGREPVDARPLPYAARPIIAVASFEHDGKRYDVIPFCSDPGTCAGRGSCPKRHSCVD